MRKPDVGSVTRWPVISDTTREKTRMPTRLAAEERYPSPPRVSKKRDPVTMFSSGSLCRRSSRSWMWRGSCCPSPSTCTATS